MTMAFGWKRRIGLGTRRAAARAISAGTCRRSSPACAKDFAVRARHGAQMERPPPVGRRGRVGRRLWPPGRQGPAPGGSHLLSRRADAWRHGARLCGWSRVKHCSARQAFSCFLQYGVPAHGPCRGGAAEGCRAAAADARPLPSCALWLGIQRAYQRLDDAAAEHRYRHVGCGSPVSARLAASRCCHRFDPPVRASANFVMICSAIWIAIVRRSFNQPRTTLQALSLARRSSRAGRSSLRAPGRWWASSGGRRCWTRARLRQTSPTNVAWMARSGC